MVNLVSSTGSGATAKFDFDQLSLSFSPGGLAPTLLSDLAQGVPLQIEIATYGQGTGAPLLADYRFGAPAVATSVETTGSSSTYTFQYGKEVYEAYPNNPNGATTSYGWNSLNNTASTDASSSTPGASFPFQKAPETAPSQPEDGASDGTGPDTQYYLRFTDKDGNIFQGDGGSLFAVSNVSFGAARPATIGAATGTSKPATFGALSFSVGSSALSQTLDHMEASGTPFDQAELVAFDGTEPQSRPTVEDTFTTAAVTSDEITLDGNTTVHNVAMQYRGLQENITSFDPNGSLSTTTKAAWNTLNNQPNDGAVSPPTPVPTLSQVATQAGPSTNTDALFVQFRDVGSNVTSGWLDVASASFGASQTNGTEPSSGALGTGADTGNVDVDDLQLTLTPGLAAPKLLDDLEAGTGLEIELAAYEQNGTGGQLVDDYRFGPAAVTGMSALADGNAAYTFAYGAETSEHDVVDSIGLVTSSLQSDWNSANSTTADVPPEKAPATISVAAPSSNATTSSNGTFSSANVVGWDQVTNNPDSGATYGTTPGVTSNSPPTISPEGAAETKPQYYLDFVTSTGQTLSGDGSSLYAVSNVSFGASQSANITAAGGTGTGKATFEDLSFDVGSSKLALTLDQMEASGQSLERAELIAVDGADGSTPDVITRDLFSNVAIASDRVTMNDDGTTHAFQLQYGALSEEAFTQATPAPDTSTAVTTLSDDTREIDVAFIDASSGNSIPGGDVQAGASSASASSLIEDEALSASFGSSTPTASSAGKMSFDPLQLTFAVNAQTPALLKYLTSGTPLQIEIAVRTPSAADTSTSSVVDEYRFGGALVTSSKLTDGADDTPQVTYDFSYTSESSDHFTGGGSLVTPVESNWNEVANQSLTAIDALPPQSALLDGADGSIAFAIPATSAVAISAPSTGSTSSSGDSTTPTTGSTSSTSSSGSSTGGSSVGTTTTENVTNGVAEDGYIAGATVFGDANGDGTLDSNDVSTTTDGNGNFALTGASGPIVVTGGTDMTTGLAFNGTLLAPAGSAVVSPLTTIVQDVIQTQGASENDADAYVVASLGLPQGTDLTTLDAQAGATEGNATATAVFAAQVEVANVFGLIQAAGGNPDAPIAADDIAAQFTTPSSAILTDPSGLAQLAESAGVDATTAAAIGSIASAANALISDAAANTTSTPADVVSTIEATATVAQGAAASALATAGTDPQALAATVTTYTGGNLVQAVAAQDGNAMSTLSGGDPGPTAAHGSLTVGYGQTTDITQLIDSLMTPGVTDDVDTLVALSAINGTAIVGTDGKLTYTAPAGGSDMLTYSVENQLGQTSTGTVDVTVDPGPSLATNAADPLTLTIGQTNDLTQSIDSLVTPGLAGDTETVTLLGAQTGSITPDPDGTQTYTGTQLGPDAVTYQVEDQFGDTATGTLDVTNQSGLAVTAGTLTVGHGQTADVTQLIDASVVPSAPGETTSITSLTATNGTASIVPDDTLTYTAPAADESDTLNYTILGQYGETLDASIPVTVDPGPTITPAAVTKVGYGQSVVVANVAPGLADDSETLSVPKPGSGTLSLVNDILTYTAPMTGGPDTIGYAVTDGYGDVATGNVALQVDPGPTATNTALTVGHGQTENVTQLVDNLVTPGLSGDSETISSLTAINGTATVGTDGTLTYTAPTSGADALTYGVEDQLGETAGGTINVTVDPGPTADPVASTVALGQSVSLTSAILAATAPGLKGDVLTVTADDAAATSGSVTLVDGALTYTASGTGLSDIPTNGSQTDSFGYTVSDQYGDTASAVATITVTNPASVVNEPLFGNTAAPVSSVGGEVYALYQTILGRAPDPVGFETQVAALEAGASLQSVAQGLLSSAEYAGDYGSTVASNAGFINQLYEDGLHRPADAGGQQLFGSQLANGTSRAEVAVEIATSPESSNDLAPTFANGVFVPDASDSMVARLYYGLLNRAPDAGGLQADENVVHSGASIGQIIQGMLGSAEYQGSTVGQDNLAYIDGLYQTALGRQGDAAGLQLYENGLDTGSLSRAQVADDLLTSTEFQSNEAGQSNASYVNAVFEAALGRQADPNGSTYWQTQLANGVSRSQVADDIVGSAEFSAHVTAPGQAEFVTALYEGALGRAPAASETQAWQAQLSNGASLATVAASIVESPEAANHLAPKIEMGFHIA